MISFLCASTAKKYHESFCYNKNNVYFCATEEIVRKLSDSSQI